jgi:mono/diheme cytochrome c family protein
MDRLIRALPILLLLGSDLSGRPIEAQEVFSGKFGQQTGEDIYHGICQGCHMPDAEGATGAGTYPALAHNAKLAAAIYPITVVLYGQRAMPSFGSFVPPFGQNLNDAQIANVLNYVRTHFGNHYTDIITTAQVTAARRPVQPVQTGQPAVQAPTGH